MFHWVDPKIFYFLPSCTFYVVSLETSELSYKYLGEKLYTIFIVYWGMLIFSNNCSPVAPAAICVCSHARPFSQPVDLLQRCLCQYDRFYASSLREMETSHHVLYKKKTCPNTNACWSLSTLKSSFSSSILWSWERCLWHRIYSATVYFLKTDRISLP